MHRARIELRSADDALAKPSVPDGVISQRCKVFSQAVRDALLQPAGGAC